jgi:AraC family transcriptional regulator
MNQQPRIERLEPKKLIGKSLRMSLVNNKTFELWSSFMSQKDSIKNKLSPDFYNIQVYEQLLNMNDFSPKTEFEKWAAVEVADFGEVPDGMKTYILQGGLYAVFVHKGLASDFPKTLQYILGYWLPKSEYQLDHREHFEILGEKYKKDDSQSEEEVWIPIKISNDKK